MSNLKQPVISVGLPAYNEEGNIRKVVLDSIAALNQQDWPWEVLVIDNHSSDGTVKVVKDMMKSEPRLRLVEHESNRFYSGSVASILREARGDYIMIMDSDGQFTVEDLPRFMAALQGGSDFVLGWRRKRHDPLFRLVASWIFKQMGRYWLSFNLHDLNCGIRMFNRAFADAALITQKINLANPELFACARRSGLKVSEVEVHHYPRLYGKTCNSLADSFTIFIKVNRHMRELAMDL